MRQLLLGVLLLPALALAEPVEVNKKVLCDSAKDMISYFYKKYEETPLWMGEAENSKVMVLSNAKTQTWTIIQFNLENNVACMLEAGKGFKFKLPGDPT